MNAVSQSAMENNDDKVAVIAALDMLKQGLYTSLQGQTDGVLSTEFAAAASVLRGRDENQLALAVDMAISLCRQTIAAANMSRDVQAVDQRAQGIAAASEEMVASVGEISRNSMVVSEEMTHTREAAEKGRAAAGQASAAMGNIATAVQDASARIEELAEASAQIEEMVTDIERIAAQTNMLAMNATIEAARAGDAGKGFAVVASEVKSLASKTGSTTEEIRQRIDFLQSEMEIIVSAMAKSSDAVQDGREIIEESSREMEAVNGRVISVDGSVQEIANILDEQRIAVQEVSGGIQSIAEMSSHNLEQIERLNDDLASSESIVAECVNFYQSFELPAKTVMAAKSDHMLWRKKLADMLVGRTRLDPDELADHHSCRLGKWYDAMQDARLTSNQAWKDILAPHQEVHETGIEAARQYNAGNLDEAIRLVEAVEAPSMKVLELLDELIVVANRAE